ncbi:DUF1064 domain-containing protein [Chitinophaga sp. RCC_12]|uniref:DUF1064 domain-containing protein n=1 Tax=Chitinophaga sp. RCC_12 TaxID=3239226 RepID=UPI003524EF17
MKKSKGHMKLSTLKASPVAVLNVEIIRELERPEKRQLEKSEKRSKYGNSKTVVDGIEFDSVKEAARYKDLKLLLKAGEIAFLKMQQPYELNPGGTHSLKYLSDFEYTVSATGEKVVEDVKGFRTREYLKKRRLMKKVHGIIITEV